MPTANFRVITCGKSFKSATTGDRQYYITTTVLQKLERKTKPLRATWLTEKMSLEGLVVEQIKHVISLHNSK